MSSKYYFEKSYAIFGTNANGERVYLTGRVSIPFQGLNELPAELVVPAAQHALNNGLFSDATADALLFNYEAATARPVMALARLAATTQVSDISVEVRKVRRER